MTQPAQPTEPPEPISAAAATNRVAVSRRRVLAGVAGTAALAGVGLAAWQQHRSGAQAAAPGASDDLSPLWALQVARPEGGQIALASLRGKPLLINFWATWCAPCLREMPEIDRFYREFGPRGWQVLGLAIDGPTPVREFLARVKVGFPIGLGGIDGTDLIHSLGNPQGGLPFSVMIGAKGQVLHRRMGATDFAELAAWAAKA